MQCLLQIFKVGRVNSFTSIPLGYIIIYKLQLTCFLSAFTQSILCNQPIKHKTRACEGDCTIPLSTQIQQFSEHNKAKNQSANSCVDFNNRCFCQISKTKNGNPTNTYTRLVFYVERASQVSHY